MTRAQAYAQRRTRANLRRGTAPVVRLSRIAFGLGWREGVMLVGVLFIGLVVVAYNQQALNSRQWHAFFSWAAAAWLAPFAWWIFSSIRSGEVHPLNGWLRLSYSLVLGLLLAVFVTMPAVFWLKRGGAGENIVSILMVAALPLSWYAIEQALRALDGRRFSLPFHRGAPSVKPGNGFGLWIGEATGHLANLGHTAGIARGSSVVLGLADAAQNVLIFGGIGSGKTTRAVNPLLLQLLDQDCGGLVFNVKGNFGQTVDELSGETGRIVTRVGPGHAPMNLLAGLTPEVAASFLKSAFLLGGTPRDGFWIDTATELCRNALGALSFLPDRYGLNGLYRYLFDSPTRIVWDVEITTKLADLRAAGDDRQARLLESYLAYHDNVFARFEERLRSNVTAQVAQALSPFSHPDLADAFCTAAGVAMEPVLDGAVYLVELPLARYGLGAKVAYTFVKLRFFNVVQRRRSEPSWNQERPLFFVCDEYQEIISAAKDALSDLTFWDKARESGCVGIIASQSVSSFVSAIGDRDVTRTVLQNFRQVLCFRTEDDATITRLVELLGHVEVARVSQNSGRSMSESWNGNASSNEGASVSWTRQHVISPQLFRQMGPDHALGLLSVGGRAYDDVLRLEPVYVGSKN